MSNVEKIQEIIDAGTSEELKSKKELLANREDFILKNSETEDTVTMLEVMTSKNTIKRLKLEIEELQGKISNINATVKSLHNESEIARESAIYLKELKPISQSMEVFYDKFYKENFQKKVSRSGLQTVDMATTNNNLKDFVQRLEKNIALNDKNKSNYPQLKKVL